MATRVARRHTVQSARPSLPKTPADPALSSRLQCYTLSVLQQYSASLPVIFFFSFSVFMGCPCQQKTKQIKGNGSARIGVLRYSGCSLDWLLLFHSRRRTTRVAGARCAESRTDRLMHVTHSCLSSALCAPAKATLLAFSPRPLSWPAYFFSFLFYVARAGRGGAPALSHQPR